MCDVIINFLGVITTISLPVSNSGGEFFGIVAIDVALSLLFAKDLAVENVETYLFIIDKNTLRVIYHPLISNPTDVTIPS